MKYWIMKSEPSEFSIDDLAKKGESFWDGVRNYQVRNMFRDEMKVGDKALFYHSSCADVGVVGEMSVLKAGEVDKTQFKRGHKYYDANSSKTNPRWFGPVVGFGQKFKYLVTLQELKDDVIFSDLAFVKRGNRLSVTEISLEQFRRILTLGKGK